MDPDLLRLAALAGIAPGGEGSARNNFFWAVGLRLHVPPVRWEYWCTPLNSSTFGDNGGDGVHFGFLHIRGSADAPCPIVMTVPVSDTNNFVVGESMREFLALGCRCGFGGLDQLAHDPEAVIAELSSGAHPDDFDDEQIEQARLIESTFALEPWPNVRARLAELQLRYAGQIEFADDHMRFEPEPELDGIDALVGSFVENVIAATGTFSRSHLRFPNVYAERYISAFRRLCEFGNEGRDALIPLLSHARDDVRGAAAAYLLRHRHGEARRVLEELVRGKGLTALDAHFLLKAWDEGTWELDPA